MEFSIQKDSARDTESLALPDEPWWPNKIPKRWYYGVRTKPHYKAYSRLLKLETLDFPKLYHIKGKTECKQDQDHYIVILMPLKKK